MKTSKFTQLKTLIQSNNLEFIMEAHNGLSSKIVEEAGFSGIWASGLSISAALGVRDNNEASWTQVLEVIEFMSDATTIPILLDGDTGYGNFNNMRRLVKKLEQRDIAGVCIEDKVFPKTNSFIEGGKQQLSDIDEFVNKIKAAKDTQANDDFCVVTRTEAFILGWGLKEALKRAEAYRQAGADAILIHSKLSNSSEIETFMKEWGNRHPIIIVPTKYYSTPTDKFRQWAISMVIWANHNLRTSIKSMQDTSQQIFQQQHLMDVEDDIVSVSEVFRLQGAGELLEAEKKYLPTQGESVNAIILAASQGDLGELTIDVPKTLLKYRNKTILDNLIEGFHRVGIKNTTVVRGFAKEKFKSDAVRYIDNSEHESSSDLYSLYLAKDHIIDQTIISFGDIIYRNYILWNLVQREDDIVLVVDVNLSSNTRDPNNTEKRDLISATTPYENGTDQYNVNLLEMGTQLKQRIDGEFIGLWKINKNGVKPFKQALDIMSKREDFKQCTLMDLFNLLSKETKVGITYVNDAWINVNTVKDLQKFNVM
jgi:phosphoenolpyruvate phosphomutase